MEENRPRILVLGGKVTERYPAADVLSQQFHVDTFDNMEEAMSALRTHTYEAIFADVGDFLPLERGLVGQQSSLVLETIGEGVCIVDRDGICTWSNNRMRNFPPEVNEKVKQICSQALSIFARSSELAEASDSTPRARKFSFHQSNDRYFEIIASPILDGSGSVRQVAAVVWDATSGKRLQQKIDAIDAAGRELAKLDSEAVAQRTPGERLQLLRDKIIRFSKDLLHFDHFAIRLVDKNSRKLEVVIAEGFPPEALEIDLYAQAEGNGISGYVAATGRSYICHDTEKDPRYVLGVSHAKSSLTVPLRLHDQIVGVFNIESCSVGMFDEDDRQFAEIFGQYVALALNILDLLVTERCQIRGEFAGNVVDEMAQPLSDILTLAQELRDEYIGVDYMRERLNKIIDRVDDIRDKVHNVAEGPKAVLGYTKSAETVEDDLLAGKRILIADDEANIRHTIANVLEKHGCICEVCKDGYEACMMLEQKSFHLVLSDIKMPHRNGYEIYAAASRHDATLPVILMTGFGYDPHHSIVRASQDGDVSVLFKPFKVEVLLDEVRKALSPDAEEEAKQPNPS